MTKGRLLNLNTDFEKFFNDIVDYQKSEFKKRGSEIPTQVLWLVKDGKITIVPIDINPEGAIINGKFTELPESVFGRPPKTQRVIQLIVQDSYAQAYIIEAQGWMWKKEIPREEMREMGFPWPSSQQTIADLPSKERIELLSFIGRTMDGKQTFSKFFEIKREIHGDDKSKLLDIMEIKDWEATRSNDLCPME